MRKKVAVFTHGGIGTGNLSQGFPLIMQIVGTLAKDFDITVYSLASFNDDFKAENFKTYSVPKTIRPSIFRWLYLVSIFTRHFLQARYTILYSFWGYPMGFMVVMLGKIFSVPSLINILGAETANVPEINYGYLRNPIVKKLVLWTCQQAKRIIAVTHYQEEILRRHGVKREIEVIPWGADSKLFFPVFNPLTSILKILHVANLTEIKDQETLLRAFRVIRNQIPAVLKVVGPDFLNGKIQQLALTLGLGPDIEFVGFVPYKKIVGYLHWADVFMLTSLSEGQNNSITEAMMCGILPVGTSVGIMHDIGKEVGLVTNCKDYQALGDAVVTLYQRPQEWDKKRKAAHEWASTHDLSWTVEQLKKVLNDAY